MAVAHSETSTGANHHHVPTFRDFFRWAIQVLGPDAAFIRLALLFGAAISLLSLATPISVQLLIGNTRTFSPLSILPL